MSAPQILVTGATGGLGSRVVRRLCAKIDPANITAGVRDIGKASVLRKSGVVLRQLDYDDPESLRKAFEGVEKLLAISSDGPASAVIQHHHNVIDAAENAGVSLLAFTSILDVAEDSPFYFAQVYRRAEEELRAARVPTTVLRCGIYADLNLPWFADAISTGVLRLPASDGRISFVSRDDIATAATALLTSEGHARHCYDITGGESLSYAEVISLLSAIAKRPTRYVTCSIDEYCERLRQTQPPNWLVHALSSMFRSIAENRFAKCSNDFTVLTGRKQTPLQDVLSAEFGSS